MNLGQLRTAVFAKMATSATNDQVLTATAVNQFINDANQMISIEHEWPWLETSATITTSSGTGMGPYTVPSDWQMTRQLRIANYPPLMQRSIDEIYDLNPTGLTGPPQYFAVDADGIWLSPNPNGVYSVLHRYLKQEAALTADGNTPSLPAQFHAALVDLACYMACAADRENARSQLFLSSYQLWADKMRGNARRSKGPAKVRTGASGWS